MPPLDRQIRNTLERAIKDARDIAEAAARAALEQLGVGESTPFSHLSNEERVLRRKLRVHGRQLGDVSNGGGRQEIDRLTEEVAYEHWHRMLFARFLAENNLLMYPDPDDPVAVSLEECEDLAPDEGAANGWELAARFAARMLPQIFRPDSPVFQLTLPPEHQQKLEQLVADLPPEVFAASDSLGWVYQFWQAKKKDEVNASEVKIGARELPAVTQLFTEPYMVSFLLDNSLGAWWVKQLSVVSGQLSGKAREILTTAENEQELRDFFSIPGVPLSYLRFVKTDNCTLKPDNSSVFEGEHWMPASGWFEGWPDNLSELKTLDPCCGSGHFLVAAFLMLVPMRMELDGLSVREAVDAVLHENIHGLEIDKRCVELAAFALALAAWQYPGASGYRTLSELNIACSGLAISTKKDEWLALAGADTNLCFALEELYKQFKDASVLGSLINPKTSLGKGSLFELKWEDVGPLLTKALLEKPDDEILEIGVIARGLSKSAQLLANRYHCLFTNVPYLTRGKQGDTLRSFLEYQHKYSKHDLATAFLERCLDFCADGGTVSAVIPQNWMFLSSYRNFRQGLLKEHQWNSVIRLGFAAFDVMDWWAFNTSLFAITRGENKNRFFFGLDVSEPRTITEKSAGLLTSEIKCVEQASQLKNPDARIAFDEMQGELLEEYATSLNGMHGADAPRFRMYYWEVNGLTTWRFLQNTVESITVFGGRSQVFYWPNDVFYLHNSKARIQGMKGWDRKGVAISMMGTLPCTLSTGEAFDISCSSVIPKITAHLPSIWCFCSSPKYNKTVRCIDQKVNVTNATLAKVPFDLNQWTKVAEEKYPNGLPKPYSHDPTQWIFHGHPSGSVVWDEKSKWTARGSLRNDDTVLHVAVARLLGYRWPAELDLNMEVADEQREWVKRCGQLLPYADKDGIVCIPPVRGEATCADRLLNLLAATYGDVWSNGTLPELLKNTNHAGKTLETWLREKFFIQHCKLFKHRPFIWHIWDGLRDGFAALVNYHKLDQKNLETLIYTYLGDWISRQKQDITTGVDGAEEKLAAAEGLKKRLELILEGESPYDIFIRWKPIEKQPMGWNPDLNDGVRLNIRPFMTVPDVGKKGAGVLRDKPNIKWNKDRGKDVVSAPWYHLFKGDRINDHHLTLEEKNKVRNPNR